MKAIPASVRERILKLYDQGKSTVEIAASFSYCVAAVTPEGCQGFFLHAGYAP